MKSILNNPKRFAIASVTVVLVLAGLYAAFIANALGDVNRQVETVNNATSAPKPLKQAETKPQDAPEQAEVPKTTNQPSVKQTTPQSAPQKPKTTAPKVKQCPAGSYRIGGTDSEPICKNEPTGCPYGDSIPVDSPKCAPPESWQL